MPSNHFKRLIIECCQNIFSIWRIIPLSHFEILSIMFFQNIHTMWRNRSLGHFKRLSGGCFENIYPIQGNRMLSHFKKLPTEHFQKAWSYSLGLFWRCEVKTLWKIEQGHQEDFKKTHQPISKYHPIGLNNEINP